MLQIVTALFVFVSAGGLSIWALKRLLGLEANLKRDEFEKLCRTFSSAAVDDSSNESPRKKPLKSRQDRPGQSGFLEKEISLWVDAIVSSFITSWTTSCCGPSSTVEKDLGDALSNVLRRLAARMRDLNAQEVVLQFFKFYHAHLLRFAALKTRSLNLDDESRMHHMTGKAVDHLENLTQVLLIELHGDELVECELGLQIVTHLLVSNVFLPAFKLVTDPAFLNKLVVHSVVASGGVEFSLDEELKRDCLAELPQFDLKKPEVENGGPVVPAASAPLPNCKKTVTTALGKALQATAGPILPQNLEFSAFPLIKMWPSPTKKQGGRKKLLKKSYSFDYSLDMCVNPVTLTESASIANIPMPEETFRESLDEDSFSLQTSSISSSPTSAKESSADLSNKDMSPDPEYEDFPDMETAITKLRAMLAQKSSAEQSVSSQESLDSPKVIPEKQQILVEPVLLDNISIVDTETKKDFSNNPYTLYCIRYDVYHWPIKVLESGERVGDPNGMELRRAVVKRRFREFLNFQVRLESNPKLRPALRGIKGPSKWANSPFGKNEEGTVTARRQLLETFLQELCAKPGVCDSAEVLEFLGYGCEVAVEYVKKPSVVGANRLDKVLARTVSGMFQSLRTALPTFDHQDSSGSAGSLSLSLVGGGGGDGRQMETIHSPLAAVASLPCSLGTTGSGDSNGPGTPSEAKSMLPNFLVHNSVDQVVFSNYNFECLSREGVDKVESQLDQYLETLSRPGMDGCRDVAGGLVRKAAEIRLSSKAKEVDFRKTQAEELRLPANPDLEQWMQSKYELSSAVVDLLRTCLRDGRSCGEDFRTRDPGAHLAKLLSCPWLEPDLARAVEEHAGTCEAWVRHLTALRWSLFGAHALDSDDDDGDNGGGGCGGARSGPQKDQLWSRLSALRRPLGEELAKKVVVRALTPYSTFLGGVDAVSELSSFLVGSLQDPKMNEDVALLMLDFVLSKLFVGM